MNYRAYIVNNATGEGRLSDLLEYHDRAKWAWTRREYNFGCDCNRGAEWARASGLDTDALSDEEDDAMFPCGYERYSVPYIELDDGTRIVIDEGYTGGTNDD